MTGPQEPDSSHQGLVWLASRMDFTHQTLSLFAAHPSLLQIPYSGLTEKSMATAVPPPVRAQKLCVQVT